MIQDSVVTEIQKPATPNLWNKFKQLWTKSGRDKAKDQKEVMNEFTIQWRYFEKWFNQSHLEYQTSSSGLSRSIPNALTGNKIIKRWPSVQSVLKEIGITNLNAPLSKEQAEEFVYTLSVKIVTDELNTEPEAAPQPEKITIDTISDLTPAQATQIITSLKTSAPSPLPDPKLQNIVTLIRKEYVRDKNSGRTFLQALQRAQSPILENIELSLKKKYKEFLKES